jgi:hypothetical protein
MLKEHCQVSRERMIARDKKEQKDTSSELTAVRRKKLGKIQFGYYSPSQHHGDLQDYIRITNDGLGSEAIGHVCGYGVYGTLPLRGRAEFEVEIVQSRAPSFDIGLMRFKKKNAPECIAHYDLRRLCGKKLCRYHYDEKEQNNFSGCKHHNLCKGDRFGLCLSEDGALEFTVNGEGQGIAAENVYSRHTDVYVVVHHNFNSAATAITKAGEMINNRHTINTEDFTEGRRGEDCSIRYSMQRNVANQA